VKAYLLSLNKDYQKCFGLYLEHTSDSQKIKVFKWLDDLSQSLKTNRQEELKALKSVVMTHFRELVLSYSSLESLKNWPGCIE